MKVLLINPPNKNMIKNALPDVVVEERGQYPPLGLMYVAAYAEKNSDYEIEILDAQVEETNYGELEEEVRKRKPDIVGIQSITFTHIDAIKTARIIKKIDSSITVVLGGPHVSIFPLETLNTPEVDFIISGEGEITFTELLNNIGDEKKLRNTRGIAYRSNDKIVNTGRGNLIIDLDSLPFPARHLTPYKKYYSLIAKWSPLTTMITSRGCPYKCLFCDRPNLGRKFRARTAKNVVDEMEECIEKFRLREFAIYDETFTVNRKRVVNVCNEILDRGLDIAWDCRARVDTVDRKLLQLMRKAGCERIHYGVESGNQSTLDILRKRITLKQASDAFKLTKDAGISTLAYFILGSPKETREQIIQTIDFSKKINPDYAHFTVMTPFPATDLYHMGLETGFIKTDYWKEFAENPTYDFVPPLWDEVIPQDELVELLKLAYKNFYGRPSYIIKNIFSIKSPTEFYRKTKAGLKTIRM